VPDLPLLKNNGALIVHLVERLVSEMEELTGRQTAVEAELTRMKSQLGLHDAELAHPVQSQTEASLRRLDLTLRNSTPLHEDVRQRS
jgi:hypothetical protein